MNTFKNILSIIVVSTMVIACNSGGTKNGDFLPPVKIEIPTELADNEDAVALIENSEKALNEFSNNIETLIVDNEDIWNKKSEDLSIMEQITLAKSLGVFAVNSTEIAAVMEKLSDLEDTELFKNLNDEQLKAFESVRVVLENRINEINAKYKGLIE
ncbi:MAG: hypothetical protein KAH07_09600 [Flavobacteriaceae bacterium]|nr:hypothetical protein [Flavobacteriaceae bacterium]